MKKKNTFGIFDTILNFLRETTGFLFHRKVSVVIPAFEEEANIGIVIRAAKSVFEVSEVIVVNDGSKDNTAEVAEKAGAIVVSHDKNIGKGAAIKTGLKHAKEDVVLFLDADLKNIDKLKISKIIEPVLHGEADFVKASFGRKSGRVTELTAKPLLKHFFPHLSFEQPLSGQFCARKKVFNGIKIEKDWGIDIGLLLDIASKKARIKEVNIGEIEHELRTLGELKPMAEAVTRTIIKKANIHREKSQRKHEKIKRIA